MTYHKKILLVLVRAALALLAFTGVASADVPGVLTQQGRLLDSDGAAVPDGEISFTFTIYDAAEDGTELWTETQDITTEDGYFSAQLGEVEAFPKDLFDGSTSLFLGVQVGSDDEMTPRQAITSVPYAMKAAVADSAAKADTATNVTGAITPSSIDTGNGTFSGTLNLAGPVNVDGNQVIDASGTWVGDIDFADIVNLPNSVNAATSSAVSCGSGGLIVSGGCAASSGDWIEDSYPVTAKGSNAWQCRCGGTSCTVTAYAICLN